VCVCVCVCVLNLTMVKGGLFLRTTMSLAGIIWHFYLPSRSKASSESVTVFKS